MNRFTNINIKKEYKKILRNLIISILIIIVAFGFKYWENAIIKEANKDMTDLNSIIVSSSEKTYKKAYLDVKSIPYKFAIYQDTTDSYYIVSDGTYLYVVYMSTTDFNKLNIDSIYDTAIRVEGITKKTTDDVKELAIESYNELMEYEEDKLSLEDFDNYFGSVYLDMTEIDSAVASVQFVLFILFFIVGIILFIVNITKLIKFKNVVKKLGGEQIDELDNEMNSDNAFYYKKANLYLTDNYIINFAGYLRIISYKDILWMYPFEQRTNGIKTAKSIRILTNKGKTYTISNVDVITKNSKEIYNEIWNTILSKNNNILTGYTKENIKAMNDKVKEIKRKK